MPPFSKWSLIFRVHNQNFVCNSHFSHQFSGSHGGQDVVLYAVNPRSLVGVYDVSEQTYRLRLQAGSMPCGYKRYEADYGFYFRSKIDTYVNAPLL